MLNTSCISSSQNCSDINESQASFIVSVMIVEVSVGLPGNLLALWIFCFRMKIWKPHAIFLFNLMLADFLLLASVPFRIDTYLRNENWVHGKICCRVNLFMLAVNRSASIAFMTIVALNRYFKVLHPLHCVSTMSARQAIWLSSFIWVLVASVRIPLLTINLLRNEGKRFCCRRPWPLTVHYVAYITEFILPWILLMFCSVRIIWYLKRKEQIIQQRKFKNSIRSVVVINLVFMICFLPAVVTGLGCLVLKNFQPRNCERFDKMVLAFMTCLSLTYLNSTLDPVIYTFSSSTFRTALKGIFKKVGSFRV